MTDSPWPGGVDGFMGVVQVALALGRDRVLEGVVNGLTAKGIEVNIPRQGRVFQPVTGRVTISRARAATTAAVMPYSL